MCLRRDGTPIITTTGEPTITTDGETTTCPLPTSTTEAGITTIVMGHGEPILEAMLAGGEPITTTTGEHPITLRSAG
jgi:hypothetical protein